MNRAELSDFVEEVHNGEPIDWDYWGSLSNITPAQASRLAFHIDPFNKEPGKKWMEGTIPDDLLEKIAKAEQLLRSQREEWSLNDLVIFFGEPDVIEACGEVSLPYGMVQQFEKRQKELSAEGEQREAEVARERNAAGRYTLKEASEFIKDRTGASARDIYAMLERDANAIPSKLTVYKPDSKIPSNQRTRVFGWHVEAYWDDLNEWLKNNLPRLDCSFPAPELNVEKEGSGDKKEPRTGRRNTQIDVKRKATETHSAEGDGRPKERQDFFRPIWERLEKPKRNDKIWAELKKCTTEAGPIKEVIGHDNFIFMYQDRSTSPLSRKTFQNDMTIIRNQK
ncbi:hypothetical protein [Methylosarcina fibrata]|uniref:hypothetical protein n=1 Tax=Methylosarcina fibrata TaxID=105972 RepID=UPI00036FA0FC|nr:hypothetical protein [Methylosarcina fibrata]